MYSAFFAFSVSLSKYSLAGAVSQIAPYDTHRKLESLSGSYITT